MAGKQEAVAEYLTGEQVSARIQVPIKTIYNWRYSRPQRGPRAVKLGGHLRYKATEVDAWLAEQDAASIALSA